MQDATLRPAPARPALLSHRFAIAAGAILIVGAVLRIYGAQGELWLDEIWSLKLIREVETEYGFLWGLTIDNNHYLNTLYLYLVGPDAPVLVQRGLSIALGILSIAAVGWAMRRSGPAASLAAMAMFAIAYPMVNYGSEARGYSGMILMTVLAIDLVEAALTDARHSLSIRLGIVVVVGFLFQPVMALSLAMIGLWASWVSWRATRSLQQTETALFRIFTPAAILLLVILAGLAVAIVKTGGYQFGHAKAFSAADFLEGYGGLLRFLLGLPDTLPAWLAIVLALAPLGLGVLWRDRLTPNRLSLAVIAVVIAPAAVFCLRPPNVEFPRYYLASGIVFLLLLSDLFAIAWRIGGWRRRFALAAALLFVLGSGVLLLQFYQHGRGNVITALRTIAIDRDPRVTSNAESRDAPVVEYFADRLDLPIRYVAMQSLCQERPTWLLTSQNEPGPEVAEVTEPGCTALYRRQVEYPNWGLSSTRWTLYRAE